MILVCMQSWMLHVAWQEWILTKAPQGFLSSCLIRLQGDFAVSVMMA